MRRALVFFALSTLACGGFATPPVADVVEPEPDGPCCTVDDVIEMTAEGVQPAVIVDALFAADTELTVTSDEIVRMSDAGVAREVIDALQGGPWVCTPKPRPQPKPAASGVSPEVEPPLNVTVKYSGGKSFELVNLSTREYTNLVVEANGEYQYRLKKLPGNSADSMRFSSFVSRSNGQELRGKLTRIHVRSDQGTWSKSF